MPRALSPEGHSRQRLPNQRTRSLHIIALTRTPELPPSVPRQSPWVSLARVISSRSFNTVWPAGTEGTGDGPISRRLTERRPNSHNLRVHGVASSAPPKRPECGSLSRQHCSGPAVGAAVCAAPSCRADQAASLSPHEGTQDRSCTPARRTSGDRALEGGVVLLHQQRRPKPPRRLRASLPGLSLSCTECNFVTVKKKQMQRNA